MERDTASLVTGKRVGGKTGGRSDGSKQQKKRIGAEIRTLLMVRWTDRKMGWAWSERVVRLHHAASVFDASVSLSRAAR